MNKIEIVSEQTKFTKEVDFTNKELMEILLETNKRINELDKTLNNIEYKIDNMFQEIKNMRGDY